MKIKIPASVKDMKVGQLSRWAAICRDIEDVSKLETNWDFKVEVVSIFSGETKSVLMQVDSKSLQKIYSDIMRKLMLHVTTEPKGEVMIEGQKFVFKKNFKKITTGQIIDLKGIEDLDQFPEKGLAVCYIQKGYKYGGKDQDNAIKYPNAEREEIFKKHFPGDEFLNWLGFFLRRYEDQKRAISILGIATTETTNKEVLEELETEAKKMKTTRRARRRPPTG